MREETLDILCNPYKGEPLTLVANSLVGAASGQVFQIRDGIPVILADEGLQGRNRKSKILHDFWAFGYDAIVSLGDKIQLNTELMVREQYIAKLELAPGDKVLETASGTASNLFHLPESIDYYGLDISFRMLKHARKKAKAADRQIELVQADAAYIPFRDDMFNLVLQMGGLQFVEDPFKSVSEMARVALPGTTVHIIDEIGGAVRTLSRLPAHTKYAKDKETALEGIKRLAPQGMMDVSSHIIEKTDFYALSFKKPTP
jgi:ubiquinone/menaquinone biosynthesis C-methylase UbiE/uncharacterized protein YbaR (Trm112 family)